MRRVVQISIAGPVAQLAGCGVLLLVGADGIAYAYLPGAAYLLVAIAGFGAAMRGHARFALLAPFRALVRSRDDAIRLGDAAVPFLVISIALAVGFQSHRLVLAQFGDVTEVAQYGIAAQFAGPVLTMVSIAAQNMWSHYRVRLGGATLTAAAFRAHLLVFAAIGVVFALALATALVTIAPLVTDGTVSTPLLVVVGAGCYVVVVAVHQPSAMLLTSRSGLWAQAALVSLAALVAVCVMIPLIGILGAAAPYLSFTASMLVIQVVPCIAISFRTIARSQEAASREAR